MTLIMLLISMRQILLSSVLREVFDAMMSGVLNERVCEDKRQSLC